MIVYSISIITGIVILLLYRKSLLNILIRILALIFLVLLTTNFTLSVRKPAKERPTILLVDASRSMKPVFSEVMKTINHLKSPYSLFFFGESLYNKPPDSANYTDITKALITAARMDPSAILLISDGNHNYGPSPHTILNNFNIPIYTFGAGIETIKDLAIDDIIIPKFVYTDDTTKIVVIVQSAGYKNKKGVLELNLPSGKLTKSYPLSMVSAKNKIIFKTVFKKPGEKRLVIRIKPEAQELSYDNNVSHSSLNVLARKIRVQYLTSHLSFNTQFLLNALSQDHHISLLPVVTLGPETFLNPKTNKRVTPEIELNAIDVLLLDNINLQHISISDVEELLKQGKGVLIVGSVEGVNSAWQKLLPINITKGIINGKYNLEVIQPFSILKPMDEFPPITAINRTYGKKSDAAVIAQASNLPIIAYREYGGIVFQINIIDLGTWQFLQSGLTQKEILPVLLSDIIRFISILRNKGRLVLESIKRSYAIGEEIRLKLQSFDSSLRPASGGDFYLQFEDSHIPFYEIEKGVYETTITPQKPGRFIVYAQGSLGEEFLKSKSLQVEIKPRATEVPELINLRLLQSIADRTGGKYYPLNSLAHWRLSDTKKHYTYARLQFNHPIFAILIILLLVIDWILRRRKGLI